MTKASSEKLAGNTESQGGVKAIDLGINPDTFKAFTESHLAANSVVESANVSSTDIFFENDVFSLQLDDAVHLINNSLISDNEKGKAITALTHLHGLNPTIKQQIIDYKDRYNHINPSEIFGEMLLLEGMYALYPEVNLTEIFTEFKGARPSSVYRLLEENSHHARLDTVMFFVRNGLADEMGIN